MNFPKLLHAAAALLIAASASILPKTALADTFQVFNLADANNELIFGIDTSGSVVIEALLAGPGSVNIFNTFTNGILVGSALAPPALSYDNGAACTPTVAPGVTWVNGVGATRCNGGHEVYFGTFTTPPMRGIFTGSAFSDHLTSLSFPAVNNSSLDSVVLNGSGDFAWVDGVTETIFEAIDLSTPPPASTPEPGSILLLGTGSLALIRAIRHRLS
jgi:hypothetical protein